MIRAKHARVLYPDAQICLLAWEALAARNYYLFECSFAAICHDCAMRVHYSFYLRCRLSTRSLYEFMLTFLAYCLSFRKSLTGLLRGSNLFFFLLWAPPTSSMRARKAARFRWCSLSWKLSILACLLTLSLDRNFVNVSGVKWSVLPTTLAHFLNVSLCSLHCSLVS